jgi:tRNA threonylcarbamoyladenosine biosynthesis protein TsaB
LEARGLDIKEIDYFACGLGPGSFTGMRVGLATLKGIALALNKRLVGISTLDILACGVNADDKPIIPAIDAKRGLIYCAIYRKINGSLVKKSDYLLLGQEEFYKRLKNEPLILGDALAAYRQEISLIAKGAVLLDKDQWYPKGRNIITLALERIKNKEFSSPFALKPIYLYPKECQIRK